VTGYSQPVTIEHRIEDMAVVRDVQINGEISFTRALTHLSAGQSRRPAPAASSPARWWPVTCSPASVWCSTRHLERRWSDASRQRGDRHLQPHAVPDPVTNGR
jgi:hypothetical protein